MGIHFEIFFRDGPWNEIFRPQSENSTSEVPSLVEVGIENFVTSHKDQIISQFSP